MLNDPKVISDLIILQEQYLLCPISKVANNIAFIYKKYYIQILLEELGLLNTTSDTYHLVNDTLHNVLKMLFV